MVWIGPPPTNRLWYGFEPLPALDLVCTPLVDGLPLKNKLVASRIAHFFRRRLTHLIFSNFVLPNCEGINLPGLIGDPADALLKAPPGEWRCGSVGGARRCDSTVMHQLARSLQSFRDPQPSLTGVAGTERRGRVAAATVARRTRTTTCLRLRLLAGARPGAPTKSGLLLTLGTWGSALGTLPGAAVPKGRSLQVQLGLFRLRLLRPGPGAEGLDHRTTVFRGE